MSLSGPLAWLTKLALFSLIYHSFRPLTYVRRLIYFAVTITGLYYLGNGIANGVMCGPKGGHDRIAYIAGQARKSCSAGQIMSITLGSIGLATDLFLFILPLRAISKLDLPRKEKTGVLFIFMTGIV